MTPYILQYEKLFGKIMIDTFKHHAVLWTPMLGPYLQFCLVQLGQFDANRTHEKFLVNLMLFIKLVITCKNFEVSVSLPSVPFFR